MVFAGAVPDADLPACFAAGDVFAMPCRSRWAGLDTEGLGTVFLQAAAVGRESFGTVLLEAMAAGRPIVTTDIEGYREVVRADVDALVVDPGDSQGLAGAIGRILENPALASRLSLSARERVQQFAWTMVTDAVEHVYREVVRMRVVNPAVVNVWRRAPAPRRPQNW